MKKEVNPHKTHPHGIEGENPRAGRLLACTLAVAAGVLHLLPSAAYAELPAHNVPAASITVVQLDAGTSSASLIVSNSYAVGDFRIRPTANRGDFDVQIGDDATDDPPNGILLSCIAENGRDNTAAGETDARLLGTIYSASMTAPSAAGYFIPVNTANGNYGAGANPEWNANVAAAWFPYTNWLGGYALNGANSQPLTNFIGSPSLVLGTHFIDDSATAVGKSIVNLTSLGIDSRLDGVLIVNGAKNESCNYALSQVNAANGTWNIFLRDTGNAGAGGEQDPVAFVFIPKTNTSVISGRFLGDATIDMFSGTSPQFTVSVLGTGRYELKIPGRQPANGVLIISPQAGGATNFDNIVSYQVNAAGDGWEIESRDTPGNATTPAPALESPGPTEAVVSFVYIPGPTPGFSVIPANNLLTTESGGTASFTVALHTPPTADVTIGVASSDPGEGTASPATLTFTVNDWNVPQTVTVTGQDDALTDGSVAYSIVLAPATSTDTNYLGLNPDDVAVANADNEGGITVSPTSGLVTTEGGGTNSFTVVLNTQPTADVTIGMSSSDPTEGAVSPASLTFTTGDWNTPQTVVVTGVDDFVDEGDIAYTIVTAAATSADTTYNGINPADVSGSNTDDDTAGLTVSASGPIGLTVVEAGNTNYTVVLNSQPSADVTVNVTTSNTAQGGTVAPNTLTFTAANWSNAQPVTVTGADDLVPDDSFVFTVTNVVSSSDPLYAAVAPVTVSMTTLDNEAALTLPSGDLVYGIGLPGVGIDGRASIVDPHTASYNSGTLTVTLTANGTADDRVEIRNTGTGPGQIGVSGNDVTYGGITIGSFSGGVGIAPLMVTFNNAATPVAAEALLRSVTFRNVNSEPSLNRRSVGVVLAHGDGGTSSAPTGVRVGLLRAVSFQEGADHGYRVYSGAADIQLSEVTPDTSLTEGVGGSLVVHYPAAGQFNTAQTLLRFDNIFGDGPGKVPTNAVIVAAELFLDVNNFGDASPLHRMLMPWDATNETWNSFAQANGQSGVQVDDVEARSSFDSQFGLANGDASTSVGTIWFSVTPDLQAWASGATNYGWVMPGWSSLPVTPDDTGFSPSEAANIGDRPRLRVLWLPPGTATASFRQGVNDYASVHDTRLRANTPDVEGSALTSVFVDWDVAGNNTDNPDHVLIRFDDIFGSNLGQIPSGARIDAAMLDLASINGNAMGDGGTFHAMLQAWQATDTWNTMNGGISPDGVEAAATPTAFAGNATRNPNVQAGYLSFELTPDVQTWANGTQPNHGWAILPWPLGGDGWGFGMSEQGLEQNRPRLRVFYTPGAPLIVMQPPTLSPGSVQVNFTGAPSQSYHVLRAPEVTGPWTTNGTVVTAGNGSGVHTDTTPLPGGAFYRVFQP